MINAGPVDVRLSTRARSPFLPANVLGEGLHLLAESSILLSFETDFTRRVKAAPQIETWQGRSAAAFTPAVILFIALPEAEDNIEPG